MARMEEEITIPVNVQLSLNLFAGEQRTDFDDVGDFHEKFGLPNVTHGGAGDRGTFDESMFQFRKRFMEEELEEFHDAWKQDDFPGMADALVDLVYVAMGTAHLLGFPWHDVWDEVQTANMRKQRSTTQDLHRRHDADIVKGKDWVAPDIAAALDRGGWGTWRAETE